VRRRLVSVRTFAGESKKCEASVIFRFDWRKAGPESEHNNATGKQRLKDEAETHRKIPILRRNGGGEWQATGEVQPIGGMGV
jgi:hypothetical protein